MRRDVVDRQRTAMRRAGLDAILSCSPASFAYVTGVLPPTEPDVEPGPAMVLVKRDGEPALVVREGAAERLRPYARPDTEIAVWNRSTHEAMTVLADLVRRHRLGGGCIGIEMDCLAAGDFAALRARLPKVAFSPIEAMLARLRRIKTPSEIALMRRLSRLADQAISEACATVQAGVTESELAAAVVDALHRLGAEQVRQVSVTTGTRSSLQAAEPSRRALQPGEICRLDVLAVVAGYQAAICRTAAVQTAPPDVVQRWAELVACRQSLLDTIRPGASSRAIYQSHYDRLRALDLTGGVCIGHGIGLHSNEEPYLDSSGDRTLQAGMVLGIQLCPAGSALQSKDVVLVEENGCAVLSDHTPPDRLLRIL